MRPLYVVEVIETNPPEGCEPVQWTLVTTEAATTPEMLGRIVDAYRSRRLIEEYWKALKTGCVFESGQLERLYALHNALAVFIPIAWHMLLLRGVVRDFPKTPAANVIAPAHLKLKKRIARKKNAWGIRLGRVPTAQDLLYAIARLGAHLPNNGTPGWPTPPGPPTPRDLASVPIAAKARSGNRKRQRARG